MLSLVLAFGIFFTLSCSTLQDKESANSSNDETTLREEINKINQEISENPEDSGLQAKKAQLLFRYSQTIPTPGSRTPVYLNIRDIANTYSTSSEITNRLDDVLSDAWHIEQQAGIKLLQSEESIQNQDYKAITSHFENAITLIPDSLQSYSVLATTHYQHGNLNKAIETLEQAEEQRDQYNPTISEKLAYLYLESGDLVEAERRYRDLVEFTPDKLLYKHGLINVLILSDKHDETIDMLEDLSEEYPARYSYQESLATELYYLFKNRTQSFASGNSTNELSNEDREELTNLLTSVHSIFETIQASLPSSEENLFRMASFYKNAAQRLQQLPDENGEFEDMESEFMKHSLPLWEQLIEINPENLGYINNLYQVYLELGMQEEAESIERSYNF
jgi:tetratricopeptide (TPR) repeat protein